MTIDQSRQRDGFKQTAGEPLIAASSPSDMQQANHQFQVEFTQRKQTEERQRLLNEASVMLASYLPGSKMLRRSLDTPVKRPGNLNAGRSLNHVRYSMSRVTW